MEGKVVTGILAAAGAVLLGTAFFVIAGQDKTPPVIKAGEAEITYTEGEGYEGLLADVTATDNKDKDVTDEIFVDRIIPSSDGTSATVVYAVVDESNNVGTAQRKIGYIAKDGEGTAEPSGDDNDKADGEKDTPDKQDTADETEDSKEDDKAEASGDDKKEEDGKEDEEEDKGELVPNGTSPAIRLTEKSATIKAGQTFNALSYVENAVDDKDSRDTLYKHIHIDGKYSTKTPGTYTLRYYVTDSNGNASNVETFTLTVE